MTKEQSRLRAVSTLPFDYVVYDADGNPINHFDQQPFVYAEIRDPNTTQVCLVVTNPSDLEATVAMGITNLGTL